MPGTTRPAAGCKVPLCSYANEAAYTQAGRRNRDLRLSDVVVIQAIRSWLETSPRRTRDGLKALRDPQIGKALALMHRSPGEDGAWSRLAGLGRLSRSAFAARFAGLVGQAPLKYLTEWRNAAGARAG